MDNTSKIMVLKLIETDSKFLETCASKIPYNGSDWYHFPFWFKKVGENLFAEYSFEQLPNGIKKEIESLR